MIEVWKDINKYEGLYQISNLGRVKSLGRFYNPGREGTPSRYLKEYIKDGAYDKKGYLRIGLSKNGVTETHKLHRLVAIHFIDNQNKYPQVNHKNGVKDDNKEENLEWVNNSINQKHAYRTGLNISRKGEKHAMSKLKNKDVKQIRTLYSSGMYNQTEIAIKYDITQANVSEIVRNKTWQNITA